MNLLTITLVLMTIECIYSQNSQFGRFGQDMDNQFSHMGEDLSKQMDDFRNQMNNLQVHMGEDFNKRTNNFGNQMDNMGNKMGEDISKHLNNFGNQMDTAGSKMSEDIGNRMNNFGTQMDNMGNKMGEDISKHLNNFGNQMSNSFDHLGDNLGKQFSNIRFTPGNTKYSSQSSQIGNIFKQSMEMDSFSTKCQSAGHPEVPELLEKESEQTIQCIEKHVNVEQLQRELGQAIGSNDFSMFTKNICAIWPKIENCIKPSISIYKSCLSPKDANTTDKGMELLDSSYFYFCDNNAERIINFINNDGINCVIKNKDGLEKCFKTAAEKGKNKGYDKAHFTYSMEECSDFQDFRRCLVDQTRQCSSNVPSQTIDDYFGFIYREADCNSASSFIWFSFVNIVLLFVTYLYSKMF